jgi:hypothetical protein
MARTKKQARQDLLRLLQEKGQEFVVKYNENLRPNRLRSGFGGLRCYCIAADNGEVVCKPWYGAFTSWKMRGNLLLREINEIINQVKEN